MVDYDHADSAPDADFQASITLRIASTNVIPGHDPESSGVGLIASRAAKKKTLVPAFAGTTAFGYHIRVPSLSP
jgi:hypothetical protein